jgi:Fur family zinc uptake transcriptional regulator
MGIVLGASACFRKQALVACCKCVQVSALRLTDSRAGCRHAAIRYRRIVYARVHSYTIPYAIAGRGIRRHSMARSRPRGANCEGVYRALRAARKPMGAYAILEAVRSRGISAPPTVYRALSQLIERGLAHRLESLSAYVACIEPGRHHDSAIFFVCRGCGSYEELFDATVLKRLRAKASDRSLEVDNTTIELRGQCADCRRRSPTREHRPPDLGPHRTSFKEIDGAPE